MGKTLSQIQHGGIHPSIRGEVWEFLLGCYDPKSTFDERQQIHERRRKQYARWKEDCLQLFPLIGSGRFITAPIISEDGVPIQDPLVLLEANLEKGVIPADYLLPNSNLHNAEVLSRPSTSIAPKIEDRNPMETSASSNRSLVFYEDHEHLSKLWDILAVCAWIDNDVGYCQDAFWCFERLMRRPRGNFRCTEGSGSVGVEAQPSSIAEVTQVIDLKLHQHLEKLGGGDYLFAVRMLMVLFRREFSFADSLYLWEMMWALEYDPDLFCMYEEAEAHNDSEGSKGKAKSMRQCYNNTKLSLHGYVFPTS